MSCDTVERTRNRLNLKAGSDSATFNSETVSLRFLMLKFSDNLSFLIYRTWGDQMRPWLRNTSWCTQMNINLRFSGFVQSTACHSRCKGESCSVGCWAEAAVVKPKLLTCPQLTAGRHTRGVPTADSGCPLAALWTPLTTTRPCGHEAIRPSGLKVRGNGF